MLDKLKSLKNHQGFMKYLKNTSWLFLEKILRMIVGLFVGIWVARYLGPDQFGLLSYAQSFVGLFTAIAMMGLNALVVKKIVEDEKNINNILGTAFAMKIAGAIIASIIIYIAIFFTHNSSNENILIFTITIGLFLQSLNIIEFYFQSQVRTKYIFYANLISLILSSILKITFILNNVGLIYFAILTVFDTFILVCGFVYFYIQEKSILLWRFDLNMAKEFFKQGWPLILSGMSFVVYNNIDKIMLQNMLDSEAVGIYSAASRLTIIWQFIPGVVVTSFMTALVSAYKQDSVMFLNRLRYIGSFLIWFAIIISLIFTFTSTTIMNLTFGKEFASASSVMIVLVWSNIFVFFNTVWNRWQLIESNTKMTFYFSLLTATLNTILNYFFIKEFGVIGASYGILVSLLISYIIFYIILDSQVIKLFIKSLFFIKIKGIQ